ncbi:MAG: DUF554 domain-containing protein [Cellulosilyticaceae bacterium]
MLLLGTLANTTAIIIGITFSTKSSNILIVILSLVIGAVIGEWLDVDKHLNHFGSFAEKKLSHNNAHFAEGFVTASLLFCVGSMAIMGSLESGLSHNHTILYTKSFMDGISALIFSTTMGVGVLLSSVSVLVYQGLITILASFIAPYLSQTVITEMNAVGGILLIGIGLSLLDLKKIKVANLLPALLLPPLIMLFF